VSPDQALAFFIFALVAAGTPGPSNIILTAVGANAGVRRGLSCLFGIVLGMGFMMFLVAFGLGQLVLEIPIVLQVLKWGGAGFLLWLSWKIATAGQGTSSISKNPVGFLGAAAFQWVNPKSWLVSVSAAGTYLQAEAGSPLLQSAYFGGLFVLAALPSTFLWLAFGASMQRLLQSDRALVLFNWAMGTLLAGSVIFFVW
jgi:threonine/homoserine/homoserine lactone efflux protein